MWVGVCRKLHPPRFSNVTGIERFGPNDIDRRNNFRKVVLDLKIVDFVANFADVGGDVCKLFSHKNTVEEMAVIERRLKRDRLKFNQYKLL